MLATIEQTITDARALLAPIPDDDLVAGDAAEDAGDLVRAEILRRKPCASGESHRDLVVDRRYIPRILRALTPMHLLAHFYAGEDDVLGPNQHGVDAAKVAVEILGVSIPMWTEVRYAPYNVQQALAMLLIAEIRRARAMSRVYRAAAA
jgi:hypothetical protein